jgi:hypothetical protein
VADMDALGRCMACGRRIESTAGTCVCEQWRSHPYQTTDLRSPKERLVALFSGGARWAWYFGMDGAPSGRHLTHEELADKVLEVLGR